MYAILRIFSALYLAVRQPFPLILHFLNRRTSVFPCTYSGWLSKLGACQPPSTVGNTLTMDKFFIQPHFQKIWTIPLTSNKQLKKIRPFQSDTLTWEWMQRVLILYNCSFFKKKKGYRKLESSRDVERELCFRVVFMSFLVMTKSNLVHFSKLFQNTD